MRSESIGKFEKNINLSYKSMASARLIATYCKRVMRHRQTNARLSLASQKTLPRLFSNDVHVAGFPIISRLPSNLEHTHTNRNVQTNG